MLPDALTPLKPKPLSRLTVVSVRDHCGVGFLTALEHSRDRAEGLERLKLQLPKKFMPYCKDCNNGNAHCSRIMVDFKFESV